jgi:PKD repeat protein
MYTIVSREWFVNGASAGTGTTLAYTFTTSGYYNVKLSVTDDASTTTTFTYTIFVGVAPQITSRSWNFGDGGSSTSATPAHVFQTQYQNNVTQTVDDNQGSTATSTYPIYSYGEFNCACGDGQSYYGNNNPFQHVYGMIGTLTVNLYHGVFLYLIGTLTVKVSATSIIFRYTTSTIAFGGASSPVYPKLLNEYVIVNTFAGGEYLVVNRDVPKTELTLKSVNLK